MDEGLEERGDRDDEGDEMMDADEEREELF